MIFYLKIAIVVYLIIGILYSFFQKDEDLIDELEDRYGLIFSTQFLKGATSIMYIIGWPKLVLNSVLRWFQRIRLKRIIRKIKDPELKKSLQEYFINNQ